MSEVARSALGKRTAQECKVQWIGNDHPDLRDPTIWDDSEDELLRSLIGDRAVRGGDVDWVELAAQFKVRYSFPDEPYGSDCSCAGLSHTCTMSEQMDIIGRRCGRQFRRESPLDN